MRVRRKQNLDDYTEQAEELTVEPKRFYGLAAEVFSKAIKYGFNPVIAHYNRAVCFHQIHDMPESALKDYQQAISLEPEKVSAIFAANAYNNRGLIYFELGKKKPLIEGTNEELDLAVKDFKQALTYTPYHINAHLNLCEATEKIYESRKLYYYSVKSDTESKATRARAAVSDQLTSNELAVEEAIKACREQTERKTLSEVKKYGVHAGWANLSFFYEKEKTPRKMSEEIISPTKKY